APDVSLDRTADRLRREALPQLQDVGRSRPAASPLARSHAMTKQVVLLRVGIDAGCGGIQGPLFEDGTFEFMCIPDKKGVSVHTYGNMIGRNGTAHVSYFSESRRRLMAEQTVHVDPEWETFTYGDPTTPKRSLRLLQPGDFLVFYCGLQPWDSKKG